MASNMEVPMKLNIKLTLVALLTGLTAASTLTAASRKRARDAAATCPPLHRQRVENNAATPVAAGAGSEAVCRPPTLRIKTPQVGAFDLWCAVDSGSWSWVANCIAHGANVDELFEDATSPLPSSTQKFYLVKQTALHTAINKTDDKMVAYLCNDHKANPAIKDDRGRTALRAASEKLNDLSGMPESIATQHKQEACLRIITFLNEKFPELNTEDSEAVSDDYSDSDSYTNSSDMDSRSDDSGTYSDDTDTDGNDRTSADSSLRH